ncbi:GFA family protein [Lysobacter sp. HA18]
MNQNSSAKCEGRCLCGQVSYASVSDPVFQFNCHCWDCQKSTGCGYAPVMFFARDALRVSGEVTYYAIKGGSGHSIARGFCANCGAQILGDADVVGTLLSIRAGTLDDPSLYRPKADVFVSQAAAWDAMDPQLPKFDRWPPQRP